MQIPGGSSPTQSHVGSFGAGDHLHPLQHRNSALSLLNKRENKALPEIGTTSANAFGKVDAAHVRDTSRSRQPITPLAVEKPLRSSSQVRFRNAHNYTGNDPAILKLLDSMLLERFPPGEIEFGPRLQPVSKKSPIRYKDAQQMAVGVPWRPEGSLVATFSEHTAAVTRVLVSPDQGFFISGSDDGTVKIWDTSRLERNITRRSRQTYKLGDDVKVSSLVFVDQTYSFVATGSDGSVHVVRIDYLQGPEGTAKFGRPRLLREYQLPRGEYAVWSEHYTEDSKSVLVLATNTSRIIALDLRTMNELFVLNNPLSHGTPTCFCVDKKSHWLLLGTSHGVLDLWDLRFKLRLKAWVYNGASPVHRLIIVALPGRKLRQRLYIAGGSGQGEVTMWDWEKHICERVYRIGGGKETGLKSTLLTDLDDEKPGGMLGRFATALEPSANQSADRGIRALAVHTQAVDDKGDARHTFLLTAGPDWKIRYWDTYKPEASMIVSGLEADEVKPQFTVSHPSVETTVVTELSSAQPQAAVAGRESKTSSSASKKPAPKSSRSGLISQQQQQLLKSHLDRIMDVALVEQPYGMVISADRSGVIYMFM